MKQMFVLLSAIALMLFTSCKKDFLHGHPDEVLNCCKVEKLLNYANSSTDTMTLTFHYDQWSNPVYVERNTTTDWSYLNYIFRYDSRNRLSDFIGIFNTLNEFDGTGYWFWHRYKYDNKDRIIADTTYWPDPIAEVPPPGPNTVLELTDSIEYDVKNRIVKEKTTIFNFTIPDLLEIHHITYTYGGDDNLHSKVDISYLSDNPGVKNYDTTRYTTYDDKVNIHRTNKIWMVVDRDFSLNNTYPAQEYNNFGLPVKGPTIGLLALPFNEAQYNCNELVTIKK